MFFLGASLFLYQPTAPSLFLIDATQPVTWHFWLFNTVATSLIYLVGISAWGLSLLCFYSAYITAFSAWRMEWDRLLAAAFFLISTSFLSILMGGLMWRGVVISGGALGVKLYEQLAFVDETVLLVVAVVICLSSFIIMTRLCFVTPFFYVGHFLFKENGVGRLLFSYLGKGLHAAGVFFKWIYGLFWGHKLEGEKEILFDDEAT